jgi:ABC-type Mn2+/Zn2+ transport system permease subunit
VIDALTSFVHDWPLFGITCSAGWLIAVMLSLAGVIVVAKDQIFVGAAVSQASTMGIAIALVRGFELHPEEPVDHLKLLLLSIGAAIVASWLVSWRSGKGRESHEAITGWLFLTASAGALLLLTNSPHGTEELKKLLASSLIGADVTDLITIGLVTLITAALVAMLHRPLMLLVMDPETAATVGMRTKWWHSAVAIWLGVTVGLSLSVGGTMYTFGCLVLPAMIAKNICRQVRTMFLIAPLVGLLVSIVSFILANHYNYEFAQLTVGTLGVLMLPAWFIRYLRRG